MTEKMPISDALELMSAAFSEGHGFRFYPHGRSMLPMLREGIDSVCLENVTSNNPPKKGDVILYRRVNGQFVLHRIIAVRRENDTFTTCGDGQVMPEQSVKLSSVIAVMSGFYRGEEYIPRDNAEYLDYVKRRIRSRILRRICTKLGIKIKSFIIRFQRQKSS